MVTATSSGRVNVEALRQMMPRFSSLARAPRLRTMREFAEQEIVIPDGPFKGFKFSVARQPHVALWFAEIDSQRWRRHVLTGPVQSGKSLIGFVIVAMYYLFECGETVILGLPSMEMATDKWEMDIEPAIRASRYRDLIPTSGTGSRGGKFESITFKNGATLKFMSGGGSDKKRSAFTSRVLIVTETDGLDEAGDSSREADPLRQLEARTASFGERARIFLECTVSTELGRTWQELKGGSNSRIALHCPHCLHWVTPGRDSLIGHQGAADEMQAYERSAYYCPDCGEMWTEAERLGAHKEAKLLHGDQKVDEAGNVVGDPPRTFTLGYRYAAPNNFFRSAAEIGAAEWRATKAENEEATERELCQFVWAVPPKPTVEALVSLDARSLAERMQHPGRGYVPSDCDCVTMGIDIGKHMIHWTAVAWRSQGRGQIIDYGIVETYAAQRGEDVGIPAALSELAETWEGGWRKGETSIGAQYVFIDSGYRPELIYTFCKNNPTRLYPTKGFSTTEYSRPTATGRHTAHIGEGYHVERLASTGGVKLVEVDADHWKSRLHEGYQCGQAGAGAITLFQSGEANTHLAFAKHQTAEEKQYEIDRRRGEVVRWINKHKRPNHWFDSTILATVAGCHAGVKLNDNDADTPGNPAAPVTTWFASQQRR